MSEWDWESGQKLTPEEEPQYIKDICTMLRNQETLSEPIKKAGGEIECDIIKDHFAAHVADIVEELWGRIEKLEYELRECKSQ